MNIKLLFKKIKSNKLINDSIWSLGGNVLGKGLALLAGIIVARFLGKDVYGEYGAIRNTILTIGTFSTFGLGYTATKYIAELRSTDQSKLITFIKYANNITFVFSGLMALLLFIFAKIISISIFEVNTLETPLRILSFLIVFNAITNTQIGILAGFGKFKEIAKINTVVGFITFIFSVSLTYVLGLNGALLSLLIAQIINCILNYYFVKKEKLKLKGLEISKITYREIIVFSTPIALQEGTFAASSWIATVLVIQYSDFGQLGMYTVALQWSSLVLFIPGILRNVVLSHLALNNNDAKAHNKILKYTIFINFLATIIPAVLFFLMSNIIEDYYGVTFKGVGDLIAIAVFSTIFTSISNVYAQAYTSLGRNWLMFSLRTVRDLSIIILFLFLISNNIFEGAMSLIISNVVLSALFLGVMILFYKKKRYD